MKKLTLIQRIDMTDDSLPLNQQIENLCDVNQAAGYALVSTFVHETNLVLIFKLI